MIPSCKRTDTHTWVPGSSLWLWVLLWQGHGAISPRLHTAGTISRYNGARLLGNNRLTKRRAGNVPRVHSLFLPTHSEIHTARTHIEPLRTPTDMLSYTHTEMHNFTHTHTHTHTHIIMCLWRKRGAILPRKSKRSKCKCQRFVPLWFLIILSGSESLRQK